MNGRATGPKAGERLFARYAHTPNALGYCGPPGSGALRSVACGGAADVDVPALARRFTGAWPYQQVLAQLVGEPDPLAEDVVRGYWTGNALTDAVDRVEFGAALLDSVRAQTQAYWTHLDDELLAEAAPTHAFHVLGVYPWSRLLGTAQREALTVLDSCRIGWGRVRAVAPDRLVVRTRHLEYVDPMLSLGAEVEHPVGYRSGGSAFVEPVNAGDWVALHWGFACDRLTEEQVATLDRWTRWQLEAMAPRLRRLAASR